MTRDVAIYTEGDVVFGTDSFKGDGSARPWLVVEDHENRPFHGDQYIALTLTTRSWMDGLLEIDDADWVDGGTPQRSYVVPWGVQALGRTDIDRWQGRLEPRVVEDAVEALVDILR